MAPGIDAAPIDTLLARAVEDHVTPGGQLIVADGGEVVLRRAFGRRARVPEPGPPVGLDTLYDLASLTKPLVTTCVTLRALEAGRLSLDTSAAAFVPDLAAPGHAAIRVRDLLAHASGLPPWRPFYLQLGKERPREQIVELAAREPLDSTPGTRSAYSDLGFIVLGAVLERAAGARLDELAAKTVFAPLGLHRPRFVDLGQADRPHPVAPTELCPRRGLVCGEVHDDNCHAAGGILGHAGLFATADDVSVLAAALVAGWHGHSVPGGFPAELVRTFFSPAGVPDSTWRLGWDGPSAHGSQAGELWPKTGVGHLGFTGCSLWIDPARARWVVLLTNRVHPSRADDRIKRLRPALHDLVVHSLG